MKRIKQKEKIKEPVRIRTKSLANGNKSLYLDTYVKGTRTYEFLHLYLVPERSPTDSAINAATMRAAVAIKAKRILDIINGKGNIKAPESNVSLQEWIERIIEAKKSQRSVSTIRLMKRLSRHLSLYMVSGSLREIDREFCIGFADYLRTAKALNAEKTLMPATQFELLNALSIALNEAVRAGLIATNPMKMLNSTERIKKPESTREYLTPEEVKALIYISSDNIKAGDGVAAFLFCCFCGLRYSDVSRLTWAHIKESENGKMITMIMKKTRRSVEVPLSEKAASFLPEMPTDPNATVFSFPAYGVTCRRLKKIAEAAGIKKSDVPRLAPHFCHDDAYSRSGSLHHQQANRSY